MHIKSSFSLFLKKSIAFCVSYFSVTVIKTNDQSKL